MNISLPGLGLFRICAELELSVLAGVDSLFDVHNDAVENFRKELTEWHNEHPEFSSLRLIDTIDSYLRCFCSELEDLRFFSVSADILIIWADFIKRRPDLYEAIFTQENIEPEE